VNTVKNVRPARTLLAAAVLAVAALGVACVPPAPAPNWNPADRISNTWGLNAIGPAAANVAYDPADAGNPYKTLDVYTPRANGNRGVIVMVHGGGFTGGDKDPLFTWAGSVVHQLDRGFSVVNVNYRLAPAAPFPAAVLDVNAAVKWVRTTGPSMGLNPATIIVVGGSAGGTIVADLALAYNRGNAAPFGQLEPVDGYITLAGPLALDAWISWGVQSRVAWGAGSEPAASPVANVDPWDPPGLVVQGDKDGLVPPAHMTAFQDQANAVGYRRLRVDYVTTGPDECRGHFPACGASAAGVDSFVDGVANRTI
jgi:acetyl esterase/lipase